MTIELLPEALWDEVEPLLPPSPRPSPKGGRPSAENKAALKGIIFVLRFGVPWQSLPTDVFGVSGSSCWRRFREWTLAGIWPEVHRRLLSHPDKESRIDLRHGLPSSQEACCPVPGDS